MATPTPICWWWRLSPERERSLSTHRCPVNSASIWEVALKHRLGKLPLSPEVLIRLALDAGFESLTLTC
jgi:PIN domain nuclease of toxin-antitoxin system